MDHISPKKMLGHFFQAFESYPPNKIKILVHTDQVNLYEISFNFNNYEIIRINIGAEEEQEEELLSIKNVQEFLKILEPLNEKIVNIQLETIPPRARVRPVSITVFRCDHGLCHDLRDKTLKDKLKNSALAAKILYSPANLLAEDPTYFFGKYSSKIPNYSFGKKIKHPKIKHPKRFYSGLNLKKLKKLNINKNDPKFFEKVNKLSKKQIGKSGKYVKYHGKYIPVEAWCREYGQSFYDSECKRDLKDAGIKVYNHKPSFGKKIKLKKLIIPVSIKKMCKKLKIKLTKKIGGRRVYKSLRVLKKQIKSKLKK